MFGGSTALVLGLAEPDWTVSRDDLEKADGYARLGCGLITEGARITTADSQVRDTHDVELLRPPVECTDWPSEWSNAVGANRVDVALLLFGAWDTADWLLDGDDQWRTIGDDVIAAQVEARLNEGIDVLTAGGTRQIIVATTPHIGPGETGRARSELDVPEDQDERTDRFNDLLRAVAAERSDVALIEYGEHIDQLDEAESGRLLPDGVHPTEETAREIWRDHLGPLVDGALAH